MSVSTHSRWFPSKSHGDVDTQLWRALQHEMVTGMVEEKVSPLVAPVVRPLVVEEVHLAEVVAPHRLRPWPRGPLEGEHLQSRPSCGAHPALPVIQLTAQSAAQGGLSKGAAVLP